MDRAAYTSNLNALADLILAYPAATESHFIIVPGPTDPGAADILPRPVVRAAAARAHSGRVSIH